MSCTKENCGETFNNGKNTWRWNTTNVDQLIKFPGKKRLKGTSNIVSWMALLSVLSETQSRISACMRRKFCKAVTKNQKANTFSWERSSLLVVLKILGSGWRKQTKRKIW